MRKIALKAKLSTTIAIITAAVIVLPVLAASIWISVNPGNQVITSGLGFWTVYMGKEPGCPERNLKLKVQFGDGISRIDTGIWACDPHGVSHYYNSTGSWTQNWYVGQGSSGWTYKLSTSVTRTR